MVKKVIIFFADLFIRAIIILKWPIVILFFLLSLYLSWSFYQFSYKCYMQSASFSNFDYDNSSIQKASFKWSSSPQDGGPGFLFPTYSNDTTRFHEESGCSGISKISIILSSVVFFLLAYVAFCIAAVVLKLPTFTKLSLFFVKTNFIMTYIFLMSAPLLSESNRMPTNVYGFYAFFLTGFYWSLFKVYSLVIKNSKLLIVKD